MNVRRLELIRISTPDRICSPSHKDLAPFSLISIRTYYASILRHSYITVVYFVHDTVIILFFHYFKSLFSG